MTIEPPINIDNWNCYLKKLFIFPLNLEDNLLDVTFPLIQNNFFSIVDINIVGIERL